MNHSITTFSEYINALDLLEKHNSPGLKEAILIFETEYLNTTE